MKRRSMLLGATAWTLWGSSRAQGRVPIADAHNHLGLLRKNESSASSLGSLMAQAGVSLLSWTVVPDGPFLRLSSHGIEQGRSIAQGELKASFERQLATALRFISGNGVRVVRTADDLDNAASGVPHVVITSEGADFLEGRLDDLPQAHERGVRHIQLVHYIQNPVGDLQTEPPRHNGLSAFGQALVTALNRHGILVDLAHSTGASIDQALEFSTRPMVWSHSFVTPNEATWMSRGYMSRALSLAYAKKIAAKGGAVGLWALGPSFGGGGLDGYASEIIRMIESLGAEHVMFGTDQDGLPQGAVIDQLGQLRQVVDILARRGVSESTLRAVAYDNYARCLRMAMQA